MYKKRKFEVVEDNGATSEKKVKVYRTTQQIISDLSKQCNTVAGYEDVRALGLGREFRAVADALEVLQVKVQEGTKNGASAQTSIPGS